MPEQEISTENFIGAAIGFTERSLSLNELGKIKQNLSKFDYKINSSKEDICAALSGKSMFELEGEVVSVKGGFKENERLIKSFYLWTLSDQLFDDFEKAVQQFLDNSICR